MKINEYVRYINTSGDFNVHVGANYTLPMPRGCYELIYDGTVVKSPCGLISYSLFLKCAHCAGVDCWLSHSWSPDGSDPRQESVAGTTHTHGDYK